MMPTEHLRTLTQILWQREPKDCETDAILLIFIKKVQYVTLLEALGTVDFASSGEDASARIEHLIKSKELL